MYKLAKNKDNYDLTYIVDGKPVWMAENMEADLLSNYLTNTGLKEDVVENLLDVLDTSQQNFVITIVGNDAF